MKMYSCAKFKKKYVMVIYVFLNLTVSSPLPLLRSASKNLVPMKPLMQRPYRKQNFVVAWSIN